MHMEERAPLAPLTTFRLGGPARFLCRAGSVVEVQEAVHFAKEKDLPLLFLGGGSNLLVRDDGFDGVVIKIEIPGIEVRKTGSGALVTAGAGEEWDALVARTVSEDLWGLENLSGIPGSVGGAVVQSIGAYGAAIGSHVAWVEALNIENGKIQKMSARECVFEYRGSFFKSHDQYVVLRAAFSLVATPAPNLSYRDVAQRFAGEQPTVAEVRRAVLDIRRGKFPDLSVEGTAGSFFKNPIVSAEEAQRLQRRYAGMPVFTLPEASGVKVPLAWIFDHALHIKGEQVGGARLFERQPLVIVARAGASAADVRALAALVASRARKELGMTIEAEVKIL